MKIIILIDSLFMTISANLPFFLEKSSSSFAQVNVRKAGSEFENRWAKRKLRPTYFAFAQCTTYMSVTRTEIKRS